MRARFAVLLVAVAVFLTGCFGLGGSKSARPGTGKLAVMVHIQSPQGVAAFSRPGITKVTGVATMGQTSVTVDATPVNGVATLAFPSLAAGTWNLTVDAVDADGRTAYSQTQTGITVSGGETTTVDMTLAANQAQVTLKVDTTALTQAGWSVGAVEVAYYVQGAEGFTDSSSSTLTPVNGVATLEYSSTSFKGGSFVTRVLIKTPTGIVIWKSALIQAEVYPGAQKVVTITVPAVPVTGSISVNATLSLIPEPPTNLAVTATATSITFTCTKSPDQAVGYGYFAYYRFSDAADLAFTKDVNFAPLCGSSFQKPVTWAGKTIQLALATRYTNSWEGPLSNIVEVSIP